MRNELKNNNKNGETKMKNTLKINYTTNFNNNSYTDNEVDGYIRFKDNSHEENLADEMRDEFGYSNFLFLSNRNYRQLKKACRRGNTIDVNCKRTGQAHTIRKVGNNKYQSDTDGSFVINLKSFTQNKVVSYIGNNNSVTGSLISESFDSGNNVNETIQNYYDNELLMSQKLFREVV